MDDEATQQQQSNVGSPAGASRGGHVLADFCPREVTVRRSDERDGVEDAEAVPPLALGPDEDLPSSGSKTCRGSSACPRCGPRDVDCAPPAPLHVSDAAAATTAMPQRPQRPRRRHRAILDQCLPSPIPDPAAPPPKVGISRRCSGRVATSAAPAPFAVSDPACGLRRLCCRCALCWLRPTCDLRPPRATGAAARPHCLTRQQRAPDSGHLASLGPSASGTTKRKATNN